MSSDAFSDLADSLDEFCTALRTVMNRHRLPLPGSPALKEAAGEPFAGEWGEQPSVQIFGSVYLTAWACADHLAASASVLRAHRGVAATYTLLRGAVESAAIACYLTDASIDARERLRRSFNCHLVALREQISMVSPLRPPDAAVIAESARNRVAAISREAGRQGFTVRKMDDRRPASLGEKLPGATDLVGMCAGGDQDFGRTSYRLLSAIAHGQLHGLSRFMLPGVPGPGTDAAAGPGAMNIDASTLAQELLVAPLCAAAMARGLCWFAGWDAAGTGHAGFLMQQTWSRVCAAPYAGPRVR